MNSYTYNTRVFVTCYAIVILSNMTEEDVDLMGMLKKETTLYGIIHVLHTFPDGYGFSRKTYMLTYSIICKLYEVTCADVLNHAQQYIDEIDGLPQRLRGPFRRIRTCCVERLKPQSPSSPCYDDLDEHITSIDYLNACYDTGRLLILLLLYYMLSRMW